MTDNDIIVLMAVAEAGSFSKAADRLGYTAAGVSYIISEVEKELGMSIFHRTHNGVRLNTNGEDLWKEILMIHEANRMLISKVEARTQGKNVILHIGGVETACTEWLPEAISEFHKEYPEVEIDVVVGNPYQLNEWLDDGRINFMINEAEWVRSGLHEVHITNDPYYLVLPRNEHVTSAGLEVMRNREVFSAYFGDDRSADIILGNAGIEYKKSFFRVSNRMLLKMIALGRGATVTSGLHLQSTGVDRWPEEIRPQYVRVEPAISREIVAAFSLGSKESNLMNSFAQCIREASAKLDYWEEMYNAEQ